MIKKLISIFILAFVFNLIWENFHSLLYVHYKGGPITEFILMRAALFDASFITFLGLLAIVFRYPKGWVYYSVAVAVVFAVLLELYALNTGRWTYKIAMPIIPLIGTGLTPTIQLGLLSYLVFKIVIKNKNE